MASSDSEISDTELMEAARAARENAYAPYSEYPVGAALLADGEVFKGANIEVTGWSTSIHAEMLAVFSAIFSGSYNLERLAVSPADLSGEAPCGLCQHTLAEFTDDLRIIEDAPAGESFTEYRLVDLIGPAYRPEGPVDS
jgi:cytidine deaminase